MKIAMLARNANLYSHKRLVEAAQARLELDRLAGLQGLDEFDHEAFGAAIEDARARVKAALG